MHFSEWVGVELLIFLRCCQYQLIFHFLNAYTLTKMVSSTNDVPTCQEQVSMNQGIASLFFDN